MTYRSTWQLFLEELRSYRETDRDVFDPKRIRLLRKMSSLYTFIPYRREIEKHYSTSKDPETAKAHVMALLWQWIVTLRREPDNENLSTHWMKLWSDTLFRYEQLGLIRFTDVWPDIRNEWLLPNQCMVRWKKTWGHILQCFDSYLNHTSSLTQVSPNLLFNVTRILRYWTWNWSIIHPLTWITPGASKHRLVSRSSPMNARRNKVCVPRSDAIWNANRIDFNATEFSHIALPLLHLNRKYVSQQILLAITLCKLALQLHTKNRERIADMYLMSAAKNTLATFRNENQYYLYHSCYAETYRKQLEDAEVYMDSTYQQMDQMLQKVNTFLESDDWAQLLLRCLDIARLTHWIPDVIFRNIGFALIPNRRIQLVTIPKKVNHRLYKKALRFTNQFIGQTWGNINHQTSLLLFLTNSDIISEHTMKLYRTFWLQDERYTRETNPIFHTTQTFSTNYRITFHLMKRGLSIPRTDIATFCHLIVYQLQTLTQTLLSANANYEYTNHRTTKENLSRTLGLNTMRNSIDCNKMVNSLIQLLNSEKVLDVIVAQEYFYQVVVWLSKQPYIPLLSVLSLEEVIRTMWVELRGLEPTEKIPHIQGDWTPYTCLIRNPAWVVPLIAGDLDESILHHTWGLCSLSTDDDETNIDIITKLPMEHPVRLPSGHLVDESTYQILKQTNGKDPFTFAPLT